MVSVINTVDTSHEDMIHDAQMDYYGTRLATCSSDRTVKIFDVRNGGQILVADLRGHEGPVWQVAWAHPMFGNVLASLNSVCWGPYEFGLILACGSSDGAISLLTFTGDQQWDIKKIPTRTHELGPAVVPGSLIDQPTGQKPNYVKRLSLEAVTTLSNSGRRRMVSGRRTRSWKPTAIGSEMLAGLLHRTAHQHHRQLLPGWSRLHLDVRRPGWKHMVRQTAAQFNDVVWHVSWSITGNILAVSGGDNKVTLWKESMDGQWACISDVSKGQGAVSTITDTAQNEQ
ncbi:hypothetical protein WMY93_011511 [Mugilogobius chulae]|uniref:Protein SEC13 homolog n=1 Tax=Mugilogobius chulae TaxID=88201 RepID=A0AAW0P482_9GOBI